MGQYLFNHEGMDSHWLVPLRLGIAGIFLLFYCFMRYKKETLAVLRDKSDLMQLLIYSLAGISACQFFYFTTIQYASAASATILQDLSPITILAVACMAEKRWPKKNEMIAIVLAILGIYLITTHGEGKLVISSFALLTGIVSALCVTVYNCYPRRILKKYPVLILQGWAFFVGGIAFALMFRIWEIHYVPGLIGVFGILFCVVVGNIMAFGLYMQGVKYIGPTRAILYGFSEPVVAAIVSCLWLKTALHVGDLVGFLFVFLMMVMITKKD